MDHVTAGTDVALRPKSGRALATWRKARAVKLALAGYCYEDIAEDVGYANRGTAWRAVNESLNGQLVENVQTYRRIELARLEALQAAHWDAAVSGDDLKAAELVLKVSAQRTKLLGLDRQPMEAEEGTRSIVIVGAGGDYLGDLQTIAESSG
jgi:hypothetical protein